MAAKMPDLIAYGRRIEQGKKERSARSSQLAQTAEKKTAVSPALGQTVKSPVPSVGTGTGFTPVLGTAQGEKKDPAQTVAAGWEKAKTRAIQRAGEQEAKIKRGFLPRAADATPLHQRRGQIMFAGQSPARTRSEGDFRPAGGETAGKWDAVAADGLRRKIGLCRDVLKSGVYGRRKPLMAAVRKTSPFMGKAHKIQAPTWGDLCLEGIPGAAIFSLHA